MEYVGHVGGGLTGHHLVGVGVDDGGHLGAVEDEEADPVPTRLSFLGIGDEHPGQTDGDVEVAGQLEQRPVRCRRVERGELGLGLPLLVGQSAEGGLDASPTRSPGWLSTPRS